MGLGSPNQVDPDSFRLIGTTGDSVSANGEWRTTIQDPNGGLSETKGYWSSTYVREGDTWKIRLDTYAGEAPATPIHPRAAFGAVQRQGRANSVSNWFVDLLAQAGLRVRQNHQGRGIGRAARRAASQLSFHSLRHTAVSLLKDAGIPQAAVQELIGHDSEQMSALYTHVGREPLEKAVAALPEI